MPAPEDHPSEPQKATPPTAGPDDARPQRVATSGLTFGTDAALEADATRWINPSRPGTTPGRPPSSPDETQIHPGAVPDDATVVISASPYLRPPAPDVGIPTPRIQRTDGGVLTAESAPEVSSSLWAGVAAAKGMTASAAPIGASAGPASITGAHLPEPGDGSALPARQVGRYQLQHRLGRGGMASVYRAHDPSIGRDVAIKFLHSSLCADDECRVRFLREAQTAGSLSHPNIVVVHDVGEIDGRPYMAMELLDGASLADVLGQKKPMPVREAILLGIQLARALDYAHAHGVIHRDIKPGNIMLQGKDQRVKVTDFGIAHFEAASGEQATMVGSVLGTPQYMSPEQTRGEKLDGRSDLFSVGIVLYQALTGDRPFRGENIVAIAQQIATAEPTSLNERRPDCPPSLRRVVERCMAKQAAQRYPTGAELGDALRKVLAEVDATEQEKLRPRIVPLRVKWALTMACIVAIVMGLTTAVIAQRQHDALMNQAREYGAAMARFMAAQNAAAALGEEWDVIDVAVQETMRTRNFERISLIDPSGIVRASTVPGLVGTPYASPAGERLANLAGNVLSSRYISPTGSVLGFEAPITFGGQQVGRVALGISEQPLSEVARLSMTLMGVLALVTVVAVGIAMYFAANWFAKPIRLVVDSMAELAKGHYSHRIAETRKDEFGELYAAYDALALAWQRRFESGEPTTGLGTATNAPTPDPSVKPNEPAAGHA
jgi:eukaryotic-like serine/threonine-protein kinase